MTNFSEQKQLPAWKALFSCDAERFQKFCCFTSGKFRENLYERKGRFKNMRLRIHFRKPEDSHPSGKLTALQKAILLKNQRSRARRQVAEKRPRKQAESHNMDPDSPQEPFDMSDDSDTEVENPSVVDIASLGAEERVGVRGMANQV